MDGYGIIALATLGCATALFITKKVPIAVTALMIPVVLFVTGVLPDAKVALRGFGNHAALAIAAIFVLGAGLKESGVATMMARGIERVGGRSERGLMVGVMCAAALLSSVMSNVAVVAILLPVTVSLSRRSGLAPSRLLMPLAIAAMLGGTITSIGTAPNFLIHDYLQDGALGFEFGIFDFAPVGLAITGVGILFMAFVGRHMLPVLRREDRLAGIPLPEDVAESFDLSDRLSMLKLVPSSRVAGQTIAGADLRARFGLGIVLVRRGSKVGERWLQPTPDLVLQVGDRLYVEGGEEKAWHCAEEDFMQFGLAGPRALEMILGRGTTIAEVALPPRSEATGKTFRSLEFRKRYGLNVIALSRGRPTTTGVVEDYTETPLLLGDTFVVSGPAEQVRELQKSREYIVLTDHSEVEDVRHAPFAILLLLVAVVPPILGWAPLPLSAVAAAVIMVATNTVSRPALARAIDWNVICLIIGTLPLGVALQQHGVAEVTAQAVDWLGSGLGTPGVLGLLFLISALLAVLTSNAAAAVIVSPVAAEAAGVTGVPLHALLLAVAYGCSCAFLLPFAQCNILVMAPGGYHTRDFLRVGLAISVVMAATVITLLSL
ncbi:MAG: SLC13 family permease [bacterium]|nr:SLC13 family permease [bacterium]